MQKMLKFLTLSLALLPGALAAQFDPESLRLFEKADEVKVPADYIVDPCRLSPDGLTLWFSVHTDNDDRSLPCIMKRKKLGAPFKKIQKLNIPGTADMDLSQACVDPQGKCVIFCSSDGNTWNGNELAIAAGQAGSLGTPEILHFRYPDVDEGSEIAEAYPWFSNDGNRLYFTRDIEFCQAERNGFVFNRPRVVLRLNTEEQGEVISGWVSPDELTAIVSNGSDFYYATRSSRDEVFSEPELLTGKFGEEGFVSSFSFSPDFKEMFVYCSGNEENKLVRYVLK